MDKERAGFAKLLTSCGLLETPFDQSDFANSVSALKDKMNQCEKVRKNREVVDKCTNCIL